MDKLRLAQFHRISNSWSNEGLEFIKNPNINIHYCVPVDESPTPLMDIGYQGYNYLHIAAQNSDISSVKELIKRGVNLLQLAVDDGQTPLLLYAAQCSHKYLWQMSGEIKDKALIDTLLTAQVKSGNALNAQSHEDKVTHLHIASAVNHAEAVEMFLNNGECVNHALSLDRSYLPGYTALHLAVHHSSVKSARILLEHGADMNLKDANDVSSLHLLLERLLETLDFLTCGKRSCCLQYHEESVSLKSIIGAILNKRTEHTIDDTGLTTLHLACLLIDTSAAENYLKTGFDVNSSTKNNSKLWAGWTPLHFAACANLQTVVLLLENGANLLAKNAKDETPLDFCMKRYPPNVIHTILSTKAEFKHLTLNDGATNLLSTILLMVNCESMLKLRDFHMSVPTNSPLWPGNTLLHLAVSMNEKMNLGQNVYRDFYPKEQYNSLPRIYNCTEDEEQIYQKRVHAMLARGCEVDVKNADGLTPVQLAFKFHRASVMERLLNCSKDYKNSSHFHIACAVDHKIFVSACIRSGFHVDTPVESDFEWYGENKDSDKNAKPPLCRVQKNSTALHVAVIFKSKSIVDDCLVKHGADTCARDPSDLTPIHLSLVTFLNEFRTLLGPNLRESVTRNGLSHLHVAAYANDDKAIERLLAMGANVDSLFETNDKQLSSMFGMFNGHTPLHVATINSSGNAIRALVQAGADIHARGTKKRAISSLVSTLSCFNQDNVEHFAAKLANDERAVEAIEPNGLTLLHFACGRLDYEWMKKLLKRGADPNARTRFDGDFRYEDWSGDSPLHVLLEQAFWAKKTPENLMDMVKLLLDHGADVTRMEEKPQTALHRTYDLIFDQNLHDEEEETWPKKKAVLLSIADLLLTSQKSFAINPINKDRLSHFHIACALDNFEIVIEFLDNGVDIQASTDPLAFEGHAGFSPLHFAAKHKAERVLKLLIDRGADVRVEDVDGNTPLHFAVEAGCVRLQLVDMLLRQGADINAKNFSGMTAMKYLLMSQDFTPDQFDFFLTSGSTVELEYIEPDSTGIIGLAMKNAEVDERLLILKKMIDTHDVKTAVKNNFNVMRNIVSVKHDGTLTHDFYVDAIIQLIEMGCDLDQQDEEGKSPLYHAATFYNLEAVKALLLLGADVNFIDNRNKSPFTIEPLRNMSKKQDARRTEVARLLVEQVWKLAFLKLEVNSTEQSAEDEAKKYSISVFELRLRCGEELRRAEQRIVGQFLNFRDFLSDSVVCKFLRMTLAECSVVRKCFENEYEILEEFPEFCGILLMQYRKASAKSKSLKLMDFE